MDWPICRDVVQSESVRPTINTCSRVEKGFRVKKKVAKAKLMEAVGIAEVNDSIPAERWTENCFLKRHFIQTICYE